MTDDNTTPRFVTMMPEGLDYTNRVHLEAALTLAGGHEHVSDLESRVNALLGQFSALHFFASGTGIDCHKMPLHDELRDEVERVDGMIDRARSAVWN